MTPCPSDEQLAGLLAEAFSASERDALAKHIEGCNRCQQALAQLTEPVVAETWLRPTPAIPASEAEEELVRRLKLAQHTPAQLRSDAPETIQGTAQPYEFASSVLRELEVPAIPGYEIIGILGRGGSGVVIKARHLALQRIVALKMLRNSACADEKALARFRAEADVIARLQHPNIVQVYDVGDVAGKPYFALEFVAGGNLAEYLQGTPQPAQLAAQFVEVLARAVQAAHSSGIVHRDLKPANILLLFAPEGAAAVAGTVRRAASLAGDRDLLKASPKIADFGLAKIADGERRPQDDRSLTRTGELLGTPSYMAPEQAALVDAPVGPAADVYALGAILYELLTGRPPFKGATPLDTVMQVLHSEPVAVKDLQPSVPRDLETICLKCLRKEPNHRYHSAAELADDLQSFLRGGPIQARPRGTLENVSRWIRSHPTSAALVAAGVLTPMAALIILSLLSARLARSSALESAAQEAELLEQATNQYSQIVQRVEQAQYTVNKTVPPTPDAVPLSVPATFLHDVGEVLHLDSKTGIQVRQFSDYPFPWRIDGGPHDEFERQALLHLRQSQGEETFHEFTEIDGEPVVRYAQARIMKQSCVDCHNTHPQSTRRDWKVGDVRGVLEVIRPLKNDAARVSQALQLTLLLSSIGSVLLLSGTALAVWAKRGRSETGS